MVCARFMDYEAVWAQALGSTAPHGRRLHRAPYFKALVPGGYTFDLEAEGNFHVTNAAQPWALLDNSGAGAAAAEALSEYGVTAEAGGISAEAADLKKFLVNNTANLISCINDTNCEGLFADADIEQVACTYKHARTHARPHARLASHERAHTKSAAAEDDVALTHTRDDAANEKRPG
jgi:hypothetical protein